MYIRAIRRAALLCSTILSFNAFAAGDRVDYDLDDDGLIEINDLADLNEIRNHLDGAALYGESTGCPEEGCNGFELTADLDFDTNGDGQMNELDTYWNDGEGWEPIGSSSSNAFTADFHGNGHQIRNLYIDRTGNAGLFGGISGTPEKPVEITMLIITGKLKSRGSDGGMLVGEVKHTTIDRVFISGSVRASWYAGGLAGETLNSTVSNVLSSVNILTGRSQGGLIGRFSSSTLANSLSTGYVENGYGLLGYSYNSTNANLHWATDTSGQETSRGTNASYFGALLSELQCPTLSDNNTCTDRGTLFESWSSEVWDFGTGQQLPGLIMGGRIYRDSDGDGSLDEDDAYPGTFAASLDTDEDGYIDSFTPSCDASCRINSGLILDAFPSSAAAYLDADLDGLVDEWADGCDATCQTNSGLTYDDYPDDRDNDGITDAVDTDDNNDGIIDADADSDGLIDIASLQELNAIRFSLDGSGQRLGEFDDIDSSGCPGLISEGILKQRCAGYELVSDLDFDTSGDGQMDELDTYWNDGKGWEPIGPSYDDSFRGDFNGNGHQIRNLYIDRSGNAGLFGYIEGSKVQPIEISQVAITGPMTFITGSNDAGVLAGRINYAEVDRVFVSGMVNARWDAGGLAGDASNSTVNNVFSSAAIQTGRDQGGLIGRLSDSTLDSSLSTGYVENGYGLLGYSYNSTNANLHWATDTSGQETSRGTNASYFGALLSELQCPTLSDNNTCTDRGTLFESWSSEVWDFGTGQQLPALIMSDRVYRDSDGDGALDEDDAYPETFAASLDTDKDGYPDSYSRGCSSACVVESGLFLDAFPENSAGWLDADLDGLVDEWADGCDTSCQTNSDLSYDDYPSDHDNDGITDALDTDDNNDGIIDADADSDGLIDIASLDELNAIRFALDGSEQAMVEGGLPDTSGCPIILWQGTAQQRCHGYELISDLDFDTNSDGQVNELDTYWNDGKGWEPIGPSYDDSFRGDFNGNGHRIRNLYIDRSGNAGLFGYIEGTSRQPVKVTQIVINGPMTSITGSNDAGVLAGRINYAEVDRVFVSGIISSGGDAGGLAGETFKSTVSNIFSSTATLGGGTQSGLISRLSSSTLANSLSTGYVENGHGLLGYSSDNNNANLYWATDTSGQETSQGTNASYFGALLSELQCPTSSDNSTCTHSGTLYESWSSEVWNFGTGQQLPGLIMGDRVYRDSDGDGALDEDDAYPDTFAASLDVDEDGYIDSFTLGCDTSCRINSGLILDAFPSSAAAYMDADLDGLVDEWADGCDATCQTNSGLTYDDYPDDRDNDGITDAVDTDDNNDGIIDADADSDGLIDIASLEELNAIRFAMDGSGQAMIEGSLPDTSGCPIILWQGIAQRRCHGYELIADLDFDTNGDGQMNELDTYWSDGEGWEPIGANSLNPFTTNFHGNGHQVRNLYIDRTGNAGLFGYIAGYETQPIRISEVVLTGPMTSITGGYDTGIFAGAILDAKVDRLFISGTVNGGRHVGGLAGRTLNSTVSNVFSSAVILVGYDKGGIIGRLKNADLSNSLATGYIEGRGGLLGAGFYDSNEFLYWATDTTGQPTSSGTNASYFGALLSELQCPIAPNDDSCTGTGTLYEGWSSDVWDFGTGQQLPALIMGDRVYRDSDGDGALDEDDAYPNTFAASLDVDEDGYIDSFTLGCDTSCRINSGLILDAFPSSAAAYMDADLDGLVDEWADGCNTTCQTNSGLTYDDYPDDRDNDGITDAVDTDDNNDGIIDADADSDGLIDIASLEELNAIRFSLDGSGQRLSEFYDIDSSGCPGLISEGLLEQRCAGYELVADLDFDTNGDGQMNELDTYWNDGEGWEPIGSSLSNTFSADFNGNGHRIRNLYIDRIGNAGLFGYIEGSKVQPIKISQVAITGPMTSITGSYNAGVLAGSINYAEIDRLFVSGILNARSNTGGLAGDASNSTVNNVFSSVAILMGNNQGGLIGRFNGSTLANSLSTGYVENGYGLLGYSYNSNSAYLHWATDTSGQETSQGTNASYFGALLSELQCPTSSDNSTCTHSGTLYESWSSEVWDFGTGQQLPALIMSDRVYRDSDGDGALDEDDAYPDTFAASLDTDEDGYIDSFTLGCDASCRINSGLIIDAFPSSAAAYLDADLDGLADEWSDGCDTSCQNNSGLTFDDYPDDRDNDGFTDAVDTDDNNDGITDADADSDGLLDIASLEELNAIRFALDGSGQRLGEFDDIDSSGCPGLISEGILKQRCAGYELVSDLDFDTSGDGQMDELDTYWNDGQGWAPVGASFSNPFTTNFQGNGHQIRNLYINRIGNAGLFGYIEGSKVQPIKISQVAITGPMTSITGSYNAGVLAGSINYAEIDRLFVSGILNARSNTGGLAGDASNSTVNNVFSSVAILMGNNQGGLIGRFNGSTLANSLSTGYVKNGHGLLDYSHDNNNANLYWATDTSGQETSQGSHASYFGALLSELQCPTAPNDASCTDKGTLYENWDSEVWDFGSDRQLPGLIMNGVVYRDSDGDGTLDVNYSPTIELLLTQNGREENTIVEGMGDVTIEVIITDENGWDYHSVEWSSNDINLADSYEFGNSITFSSDGLVAGDYTISTTVTDTGIPQLSDTAEMTIRVISNVDPAPAASSGGGGSGGGAMFWLLALLSAPLLMGRVRA